MDADPITDVIFLASLHKVPENYTVITKTRDTNDDADLCKDGLLHKYSRYLAYTKNSSNRKSSSNVLVELIIANDKDSVPNGFTLIEKTSDTREKCFRKKVLCARFGTRSENVQAITELMILSRFGNQIAGSVYIGDLTSQHGLACVLKSFNGPSKTSNIQIATKPPPNARSENHRKASEFRATFSPMSGVPFAISKTFQQSSADLDIPIYCLPKSARLINKEYSYNFSLETSLLNG